MHIYKPFLISCICLAFHFHLYSQNPDTDGYYVNLKSDTFKGKFIHFRESGNIPSEVSFRAAGSSALVSLTPDNCKMFSIGNSDVYVSYKGKRLTNPTDYNVGQEDSTNVFREISTFLHELYNNGYYRLFEFAGGKRSNFYVNAGNGPLQELFYKEFIQNGEVIESQEFRHQLAAYFSAVLQKNPDELRLIERVVYNSSSLTDLFNKMAGGNIAIHPKMKYPAQVFLGFGASSNRLSVTEGGGFSFKPEDEAGDYPSQVSPLFEVGLKLFLQRNYGRLFFVIRTDYYQFKHAHEFDDNVSFHTITTFKSDVLSFPFGIGYKVINKRNFSLELSAGPSLFFLLNNSEVKVTNSVIINESPNPKGFGLSFFGEASAVLYNRISFFAGYYTPVSISNAAYYTTNHISIRYGARIRVL